MAWVVDITGFELNKGRKVYVYFCIDIFTNRIIVSVFKTKTITTYDIVKKLSQGVNSLFIQTAELSSLVQNTINLLRSIKDLYLAV